MDKRSLALVIALISIIIAWSIISYYAPEREFPEDWYGEYLRQLDSEIRYWTQINLYCLTTVIALLVYHDRLYKPARPLGISIISVMHLIGGITGIAVASILILPKGLFLSAILISTIGFYLCIVGSSLWNLKGWSLLLATINSAIGVTFGIFSSTVITAFVVTWWSFHCLLIAIINAIFLVYLAVHLIPRL